MQKTTTNIIPGVYLEFRKALQMNNVDLRLDS